MFLFFDSRVSLCAERASVATCSFNDASSRLAALSSFAGSAARLASAASALAIASRLALTDVTRAASARASAPAGDASEPRPVPRATAAATSAHSTTDPRVTVGPRARVVAVAPASLYRKSSSSYTGGPTVRPTVRRCVTVPPSGRRECTPGEAKPSRLPGPAGVGAKSAAFARTAAAALLAKLGRPRCCDIVAGA